MIAGSLFSGIEGFGLGLIWSGLVTRIAFQVEIDPFCRRVLEARFPHVDRSVTDVRTASASVLPAVDMLFGGFPCQDVSSAGRGAGLDGERSGLWYEFRRLVDEMRPRAVLVENVASGARRWVCAVRSDLRALGYRTRALNIGVDDCGGPHRRKRIFILAYTERGELRIESGRGGGANGKETTEPRGGGEGVADADRVWESQRGGHVGEQRGRAVDGREALAHPERAGREGPRSRTHQGRARSAEGRGLRGADAQSAMGSGPYGLPARVVRWPAGPEAAQEEWEPPRVLASVEERAAKLKAIGNAVSPIQAYHVGRWAREVLRV